MTNKILILGGQGRIGASVARDLAAHHSDCKITITGRSRNLKQLPDLNFFEFLALDLDDINTLQKAIADFDLVIHCAGPFDYRDGRVLEFCITNKVNYIDVSDRPGFYQKAVKYRDKAKTAGVTAILSTGVFPGISNCMARLGVEKMDKASKIHLSYLVAGSGGAGVTVMRTTFLGLRSPFEVWMDGKWQKVLPYSAREVVKFPSPYGKLGVYWFEVAETYTLAKTFDVDTVVTKFGSVPDFYNYLTWFTAKFLPARLIQTNEGIESLSKISYQMTQFTDRFSGLGIAIKAEVTGTKAGKEIKHCSNFVHENTAIAAGCGTGSVAQLLLDGKLNKPGVWAIEQILPSDLFEAAMKSRGIEIKSEVIKR